MYRKPAGAIPSDAQAREKLVIYVYEYLHHIGAKNAAETFLNEINWTAPISPSEAPGFLHAWWCVFWDLYCAAPERRDTHPHSKEASSFHDYTNMPTSGHPLSPNMNGMGFPPGPQGQPQLAHRMGDGGPVPVPSPSLGHQLGGPPGGDGGMPPGFFPGSHIRPSSQMMSHGGMMHSLGGQQQPSSLQHHPGQGPQQQQLQQGQSPGQGPPTPGGHMQNGPMGVSPHPGMGMIMQPGGSPFLPGGPRGPYGGPNANRTSPGSRMPHPSQQQMEFSAPPGSMMMPDGGPPQGMMIGRSPGGMARGGGMPPSPMPPGAYGPPGLQRMHNPGLGPGGSPSHTAGGMGMPSMHQQQQRPWQHQGPMGYSPPSPPNGSYMNMMGPPSHMQSPSQESVLSGGSDNIYGMMKVADRYGNSISDGSMQSMGGPVDMGVSLNGDGSMEMKHSPNVNGSSNVSGGGQNVGQTMDSDDYAAISQYSAAAASATCNSSQD